MSDEARRLTPMEAARLNGEQRLGAPTRLWSAVARLASAHARASMTVLGLFLFVLAWEIASLLVHDAVILPAPGDTVATWFYYLGHTYPTVGFVLWRHALFSTMRILVGFVVGTAIGIAIGASMAAIRPIRSLLDPLIELTRPLPPLAFIPIFIVWFGIGDLPKVILIMVGVIPVMTVSTVTALDQVPQDLVNAARSLGASSSYALVHVRIRAAVPYLITGMRIAMGGSWTSIVAAEMIVATNGLGYVILQAGLYLDTKLIFAGILSIGLLGIAFDAALRWVQRRADPSRQAG